MPFPVDEKYILQTEEKLGTKFPAAFRRIMMVENGGEVETPPDAWQLYPFFDMTDMKRIKRTCADIIRETNDAKKWHGFPDGAVAIGNNGGGDQLVFLPGGDNTLKNEVYWWDHETGAVNMVADCFSKLKKT